MNGENLPDEAMLKKFKQLAGTWAEHRKDLTHMIYFSLAVIMVVFINLDKLDLVTGSPVVKVIDVFGLLLLLIVAIWSYYERGQGDNLHALLKSINDGHYNLDDSDFKGRLHEAVGYTQIAERGYPFVLLVSGVGIFTLNLIAYIVFGPTP